MDKFTEVNSYIGSLSGEQKEWTVFFVEYMRKNYPQLEEVISFKMPTYKLGSGKYRNYISFSVAKNHFSLHTMDFEYISLLKEKLSKSGKGKGCVNVLYSKTEEREILTKAIDEIVKRGILTTYGR